MPLPENQMSARKAADCHFHIIDPQRFPFSKVSGYQPQANETGTFRDFAFCMAGHGISHGLAIQPSGYGFDNAALLDSVRHSKSRLKGIGVALPGISNDELYAWHDAGIVGLRFNLVDYDPDGLDGKGAEHLLERIRELGWFADIQCSAADFPKIEPLLRRTKVRVILDHLGRPEPRRGISDPGFQKVLLLADTGRAVVKLSGAFRESNEDFPYSDLDPFVAAILEAYTPDNCIWGSDWPFLNMDSKPEYGQTMDILERWLPNTEERRQVLWKTPARLFGFR